MSSFGHMPRSEPDQEGCVEVPLPQSVAPQTEDPKPDTSDICRYDGRLLRELTAAYNRAVHKIPHCYAVSVRDFQQAVVPASGGAAHPERHSEAIFLDLDPGTGSITGFIHVAIGHLRQGGVYNPAHPEMGLIRFFWYRPGSRPTGARLLDAAEAYCRDKLAQGANQHGASDTRRIFAFPQRHVYPFYHLISAYMSDRLGHVEALLGLRGYERVAGEVYLDWRNFEASTPDPDPFQAEYTVEYPPGRGWRPGVVVRAHARGQEIGICQNYSAAEYACARPNQDWIFTKWLGVSQEYQGRGLGHALLQRALYAAREVGYRHAAISTSWKNYRAITFYSNFGYQIVDWTYGLARNLE